MTGEFIERHGERLYLDQYFTPNATARRLVDLLPIAAHDAICEAHVGRGAFLDAVDKEGTHRGLLLAMDIDPDAPGLHENSIADARAVGDFLDPEDWPTDWEAAWILGNPPYGKVQFKPCGDCDGAGSIPDHGACETCAGWGQLRKPRTLPVAEAHIRRALALSSRHVCFLLRQGILATHKRAAGLWAEHPPRHIWSLGWRPSFTDDGKGDRYDYAFVWWDNEWTGTTTWTALTEKGAVDKPMDSMDNSDNGSGKPLIEVLDGEEAPCPSFTFDLASFSSASDSGGQILAAPEDSVPPPPADVSMTTPILDIPLPPSTPGLDKILLNTGPSPNGWHKAETFMLCPRRRGWDWEGEREPGKPWHSEATARGTLLHVALAHHYARIQAVQEDRDPDTFYTPEIAVALMPQVETNPHDARMMTNVIAPVIEAYKGYVAHYAMETFKVLAVETVVEIDIPGMGGPGQPPRKTARVDLIYVNRAGKIVFVDHKSAGRITKEHRWQYARSGQFLMMRWLGAGLGEKFGGVMLNLVQVGNAGTRYERPSLDPVPGFLTSLPLSLGYWERQRVAFEESGLPPELWPTVPSEHSCRGRYASRCPHADKCDHAVPPITSFEWPTIDLSGLIQKISRRTA